MWDGRQETRSESQCPFCDTDFFSHTMMEAKDIITTLYNLGDVTWVTISGGEPALQVDSALVDALHDAGYKVAVETNGTRQLNAQVDHVTVSPKLPAEQTVLTECDSLKLLYPHPNPAIRPENYVGINASTRYLQPIDADDPGQSKRNLEMTLAKLYELKDWKLSLQTHKLIGVE